MTASCLFTDLAKYMEADQQPYKALLAYRALLKRIYERDYGMHELLRQKLVGSDSSAKARKQLVGVLAPCFEQKPADRPDVQLVLEDINKIIEKLPSEEHKE